MAASNRKKSSGSRIAALVILTLIIAAVSGYYLFSPGKNSGEISKQKTPAPGLQVAPVIPATPQTTVPQPLQKKQNDYPATPVITDTEKPGTGAGSAARLAIIIDDMGSSVAEARSLAAIKVPLTFAIIPGLRADKDVAAYAATNNIETMIHIPMQSKGWPARPLEANGLLVSMAGEELQERVSGFIKQFPGAVGANNHMGSEFTEQDDKMLAVLQVLKKKNLFFVDSVTSSESVALRVTQQLGIRSARRNVFLDNEQERSYIIGQLNQAVRLARKTGAAVAICHPHPATIATLSAALPGLADQGITLVSASQLVK